MNINTEDGCSLRHYIAVVSRVKNGLIILRDAAFVN